MGGTLVLDLAAERNDLATICSYAFPAADLRATERRAPAPLTLVDRISGPIMGFWGDRDENVGIPNVHRLVEELTRRGVSIDHVIYPGLVSRSGARIPRGRRLPSGSSAYASAADPWGRAMTFLGDHLVGGS